MNQMKNGSAVKQRRSSGYRSAWRTGLAVLLAAMCASSQAATTYNVGPAAGQLPNLASVPWGGLQPGDVVNIHSKPGGYHEIIQISESGTAQAPIVIQGVPDPVTGALPIIDGAGAITAPNTDF